MEIPAESLSGLSATDKVVTAADGVALIRDGDTVVVEGFAGQCFAEELTLAPEARVAARSLRLPHPGAPAVVPIEPAPGSYVLQP